LTFRVLAAAELEVIEAAVWYDEQRPNLGDEFLQQLADALHRIRTDPLLFARLEQLAGHEDVRRCLLIRFPYLVIYRYRPEETLIVAVSHVRRKPFYWLERVV
jgi:plasmid stabilization system protein ParE